MVKKPSNVGILDQRARTRHGRNQAPLSFVGRCPLGVKRRNTPFEQMWSALPPTTDMRRLQQHVGLVPIGDITRSSIQIAFNSIRGADLAVEKKARTNAGPNAE
jgi:hypothetical protein